jgi:hypothetical protein
MKKGNSGTYLYRPNNQLLDSCNILFLSWLWDALATWSVTSRTGIQMIVSFTTVWYSLGADRCHIGADWVVAQRFCYDPTHLIKSLDCDPRHSPIWYHMPPAGFIWHHTLPAGAIQTTWIHTKPPGSNMEFPNQAITIWHHLPSPGPIWRTWSPYGGSRKV